MEDLPLLSADDEIRFHHGASRRSSLKYLLAYFEDEISDEGGRIVLWIGQEDAETISAADILGCWKWADPILNTKFRADAYLRVRLGFAVELFHVEQS